jgi:hypothetical protein
VRRRAPERRLLAEATLIVAIARAALSIVPYGLLRRARRPVLRLVAKLPPASGSAESLVAAVRAAARHVPGASCLTQAIALHLLLERRRIGSHLVVGVARHDGRFRAHAWVDRDGEVLLGGDIGRYNALLRLGRSAR